MKVIIVGGVAGGATAAARIRRRDERAEIIVFERSGYVSYANCGLPYYIGNEIKEESALTLQTPAGFRRRFGIDVRIRHEVMAIDPAAKTVSVHDIENDRYFTETYDKLLLAPGAKPTQPRLTGADGERIFTLRTVEDTLRIRRFIEEKQPRSVVLAGGGFISLEMAENLHKLGLDVTIVQRPKQVLAPLDADMAAQLHALLREKGIRLKLGSSVAGFEPEIDGVKTLLENEPALRSDMVLLAIGVTPDTRLAKDAGLKLGAKGAIAVDDRMRTSAPDIYAVGDAVEIRHSVTNAPAVVPLAGPANKQGRIAADNICGDDRAYRGAQGSSVLKLFHLTAASTGINETQAKASGIDYDKIVLSPASHASYYPGAKVMTMKILWEKHTLRLLGAQIVGGDGVDKRIDVLATAIHAGMAADELAELDLAYAPPYASAKDPVNMAGYMIENIEAGLVKQFHWHDVAALPRDGSATLLDARTPGEYARGHAEGFVNIPLDDIRARIGEIPADKPVFVMCQSGLRSYLACRILAQNGYDCSNFSGGYRFYDMVISDRRACDEAWPCGMDK